MRAGLAPGRLFANRVVEAGDYRQVALETVDCLYVADPWRNVVEVPSESFDRLATKLHERHHKMHLFQR